MKSWRFLSGFAAAFIVGIAGYGTPKLPISPNSVVLTVVPEQPTVQLAVPRGVHQLLFSTSQIHRTARPEYVVCAKEAWLPKGPRPFLADSSGPKGQFRIHEDPGKRNPRRDFMRLTPRPYTVGARRTFLSRTIVLRLYILKVMKIAVIGGTGGMGQSLIRFFNLHGLNAIAVGRKTSIPKQILESADVIVISVPSNSISYAVNLLKPLKLSKKLIVSLGSVMSKDEKALKPLRSKILHLHQLFGPNTFPYDGQKVIVSGNVSNPYAKKLILLLKKNKVQVMSLTIKAHDSLMSKIQALSQFSIISLAKTLSEGGGNKKDLLAASTVTFGMTARNIERILAQKADLWAFLQFENPFVLKLLKGHLNNVQLMIKTAKNKDYKKFEQIFNKTAKFWK